MDSRKLIVTHRARLVSKYALSGADAIDGAVAALIAADAERGLKTHYVHLDIANEVEPFGTKPVTKKPAAADCKKVIDKIFAVLKPEYLVLLGSDDVIPHFVVPNPALGTKSRDPEKEVPTDNPYASSQRFNLNVRRSYLITDRVVGRIPDLPNASDPTALLNYLDAATTAAPLGAAEFALDLLVCCDLWKDSGNACAAVLGRQAADLFLSPPTLHNTSLLTARHHARLQMIKCHGLPFNPAFYGDNNLKRPEVLTTSSLLGRTADGTVVGAMCCFGAAVYDPTNPAVSQPGVPGIASTYLDQRASGFVGSTCLSYVGTTTMGAADVIVTRFLQNVMAGDSLGTAFLNSKQQFVADIGKAGQKFIVMEEKTLLQFVLLGDPSLRPMVPDDLQKTAATIPEMAQGDLALSAAERRSRRDYHIRLGRQLRELVPTRVEAEGFLNAVDVLQPEELELFGKSEPLVQRVRVQRALNEASGKGSFFTESEETLQYYWFSETPHEHVIDVKVVIVETDLQGKILRKRVLVSA
ncbi:MAG: C25 family cysteine peptidase [Acidobacteriota bacterium]|nr:C25 family cysteine peptidase [Acidobacteriota bacterium]